MTEKVLKIWSEAVSLHMHKKDTELHYAILEVYSSISLYNFGKIYTIPTQLGRSVAD